MKLLIASDIHGSAYWCGKLVEVMEEFEPDHLILLGDLLYHGPRTARMRSAYLLSMGITCLGA